MKKYASIALTALAFLVFYAGCKKNQVTASVMMINAAAGSGPVSFFLQGDLQESNIAFENNTSYFETGVDEGDPFNSEIKESSTNELIATLFDPEWLDQKRYAVVLFGSDTDRQVTFFADDFPTPAFGQAKVRFIHLSPDAPAVDVLADSVQVVTNKEYYGDHTFNGTTDFQDVPADEYTIKVKDHSSGDLLLSVPAIELVNGKGYTFYLIGLSASQGNDTLTMKIVINN